MSYLAIPVMLTTATTITVARKPSCLDICKLCHYQGSVIFLDIIALLVVIMARPLQIRSLTNKYVIIIPSERFIETVVAIGGI